MNINKFTQKSMEAVQNCEKLAYEYGNQQIDEQHLLYSLLTLEDSLILKLITKMGIQGDMFSNEAKQAVERLPKVSGSGQLYISSDLNKVLISGEDEAKAMGDEYVSVEHLFLSLLKPVSYTHLVVYKRQRPDRPGRGPDSSAGGPGTEHTAGYGPGTSPGELQCFYIAAGMERGHG